MIREGHSWKGERGGEGGPETDLNFCTDSCIFSRAAKPITRTELLLDSKHPNKWTPKMQEVASKKFEMPLPSPTAQKKLETNERKYVSKRNGASEKRPREHPLNLTGT